ncbi:MAG: hypothetical protein JWR16_805 [Nevskia sp.]|nr:hypothetical protein [Nevskia sp.]
MSAQNIGLRRQIHWESWALTAEADRRFRRIVLITALSAVILGILFSLIKIIEPERPPETFNSTRYAELLRPKVPEKPAPTPVKEEPTKPAPKEAAKPEPKQQPKPVKQEEPKPAPDKTVEARKIAEKSGILALKDQLAGLRDSTLPTVNDQPLITGALTSKGAGAAGNPDAIAASARNASGGIGGNQIGVSGTQGGAGVGTRQTGAVSSGIGFGKGANGPGGSGTAGRSRAEIQEVFDRNKGAISSIFTRAQRANPDMANSGKITFSLTIAPNGSVTSCTIISSSFHDPDLERQVIERVKLMNFGAKNVPPFTDPNYPLTYISG